MKYLVFISKRMILFGVILPLVLILTCSLFAQTPDIKYPPRPGDRDFIYDGAGLLHSSEEGKIRKDLDKLLTDRAIPIIVVTINSLGEYRASRLSIEQYAFHLFNHWGIGFQKLIIQRPGFRRDSVLSWDKGILLLISVMDRKARIELGADYGHTKDALCSYIMQKHIIPYFKQGNYSAGIKNGVRALEQMAREKKITPPPRPFWHYALIVIAIALFLSITTSLMRRGHSGLAWRVVRCVFSIIDDILYTLVSSNSNGGYSYGSSGGYSGGYSGSSFGGGSSGGGSSGGGSSGGGGATGSW